MNPARLGFFRAMCYPLQTPVRFRRLIGDGMTPTRILVAALALALTQVAAFAGTRSCAVDGIEGAEARAWHGGAWVALATGTPVPPEAKVATGPDTRVNIRCDDGTVITIGPGTEVNLERVAGPSGPGTNVVLQLIEGIVGLVAPNRTWDRFEVRTPVAIASVRSTEWLVEISAADEAAVFVRAGRVAVLPSAGTGAALGPGEGITVAGDGAPGPVKTWGAERIARATGALGFGWR